MSTASIAHWDCQIDHPPQQGYRPGRMHRRGCAVATGHEKGTTALECMACRSIYNPKPKTSKRVRAADRHYSCSLSRWEHQPPLRRYARAGHQDGCPTRPNHLGGAGFDCFGCRALYAGRDDSVVPVGTHNDDPHWNCSIPAIEHKTWHGKGFGHRRGCQVADGHTPDVEMKGCLACRQAKYKATARPKVLRNKYSMTTEEYALRLTAQEGRCAICREEPTEDKSLGVDHSHVTNENRGLLCYRCNLGLGYFRDREDWLASAAEYLRLART